MKLIINIFITPHIEHCISRSVKAENFYLHLFSYNMFDEVTTRNTYGIIDGITDSTKKDLRGL